jgi:hypothetical protein
MTRALYGSLSVLVRTSVNRIEVVGLVIMGEWPMRLGVKADHVEADDRGEGCGLKPFGLGVDGGV